MKITSAISCLLMPAMVQAATLDFPSNAQLAVENITPNDSHKVAIGPYQDGFIETQTATGEVTQQAWRINATGLTTSQILSPLRDQLLADGFTETFSCETQNCGGFDFRFGIDVLPAPNMFVNLGDFHYFSARKDGDTPEFISLLVSATSSAGYAQVTRIGAQSGANGIATSTKSPVRAIISAPPADFVAALEGIGRSVLSDLTFETGSSNLGSGSFGSLQALADYLATHPTRTVALVGHTDSEGSLSGNISLSKRRAASVLERLVSEYNVPRAQLEAEGMGYLSPVASNLTEEGREANRRVEVIMTATE